MRRVIFKHTRLILTHEFALFARFKTKLKLSFDERKIYFTVFYPRDISKVFLVFLNNNKLIPIMI